MRMGRIATPWLVLAMTVVGLASPAATALGQTAPPDLSSLDGGILVATCQANAESEEDLQLCLDVVTRILVPGQPIPTASASAGGLAFEPIELSGRGDKVARVTIPGDAPVIAEITHAGDGYFGVHTLGESGEVIDLLVNEAGRYRGTVLLNTDPDVSVVAFEVSANGRWTITVEPVAAARTWDTSGPLQGTGSDIVLLSEAISGFAASTFEASGDGYFGVHAYTLDGSVELLINDVAPYSGEVLLPDGTALLEVDADGRWEASAPQ